MLKLKRNSKVNRCEQYKLDLTDYATGDMTFLTKKKQQKLFEHLRKCSKCLNKFFDYERIYATSATLARSQNPKFRNRMDALIEQFKMKSAPWRRPARDGAITRLPAYRQAGQARPGVTPEIKPFPGEVFLNHDEHIGNAAVKVWHYLYGNGKIKVNALEQKVELPSPILNQALGWLARGNQIHRTRVKKSTFVYLAPEEIQKYQAQAQV